MGGVSSARDEKSADSVFIRKTPPAFVSFIHKRTKTVSSLLNVESGTNSFISLLLVCVYTFSVNPSSVILYSDIPALVFC